MAIPYFDAHCDTIWRCMVTEPVDGYGDTEAEQRAYFQSGGSLRQNGGHVDLERSRGFARRGQFFALYDDVKALPDGTVKVVFEEPVRAVTGGQAVVLYDEDVVVGGGTILG